MEIYDFLPKYPNVEKQVPEYMNTYKKNFFKTIYDKTEFYENKLKRDESIPKNPGEFMKAQKTVSRYFNALTIYDRLLLLWTPGTGKSLAAVAAIEKIRSQNSTIDKAMVFAKGVGLLKNFQNELVFKGTKGTYIPENYDLMTEGEKQSRVRKKVREYYEFYTFQTFAKEISTRSNQYIRDRFSNKVIVIDEVHNLRAKTKVLEVDEERTTYLQKLVSEAFSSIINSSNLKLFKRKLREGKRKLNVEEFYNAVFEFDRTAQLADIEVIFDKFADDDTIDVNRVISFMNKVKNLDVYKQFWRLTHIPENIKVILLSGTPMKDQPSEIASVMNLLLPVEEQLPMGLNFKNKYLNIQEDGSYTVKPTMVESLKKVFKSRVSYLTSVDSAVKKVFVGEILPTFKSFVIDVDIMSDFQSRIYDAAYQEDIGKAGEVEEESTRFYENSSQASLFVFPDGSYGKLGFNKYVKLRNKKYYLSDALKKEIVGSNNEESLKNIRKLSSKYSETIRVLLENYETGKSSFVYSEYVTGSGIILFSLLLELFGFSSTGKSIKQKKARYLLLSDFNLTYSQILENVERFNQPDNMNGEYISVILGSRLVSEGFTFKNIQSETVLTPFWNYSETSQVIARGYRFGSHEDLIRAGYEPVLYIYQRASQSNNEVFPSIDIVKYKRSEVKDFSIKRIEQLMKEAAFDCALNYGRNFKPGNDFTRECNYQLCAYKCDGINMDTLLLPTTALDYSTYNLYYSTNAVSKIIDGIKTIFRTNFIVDFKYLKVTFSDYNEFEILKALYEIITKNVILRNKYGFASYLKEDNNTYFLSNDLGQSASLLTTYYTQNPTVYDTTTFQRILNELYISSLPDLIKEYRDTVEEKTFISYILSKIPTTMQQFLFENSKLAKTTNTLMCNTEAVDAIVNYFTLNDFDIDGVYVNNIRYSETRKLRCLYGNEWKDCKEADNAKYADFISKGKKIESPFGFVGVVNPTTNDFCIKKIEKGDELDPRKRTPGKVCTSYDKNFLVYLTILMGIRFPDEDEDTKKYYKKINKMIDIEKSDVRTLRDFLDNILPDKQRGITSDINKQKLKDGILWSSVSKRYLCKNLRKFFEENNLIITDVNCGTSKKKRK